MSCKDGRHFLQIPGPTNVPDRILHAIGHPTIDHRGPQFQKLSEEVLLGTRRIFKTSGPVMIFPTSGTGAWEASLMNTLSPGDKVLMFETGHFATLWYTMAKKIRDRGRFCPDQLATRRRSSTDCRGETARRQGLASTIKAVNIVHNETSTGVTSRIAEMRKAMDNAGHPAC